MEVHTCNSCIWEAETIGSQIQICSGQRSKTLSQKREGRKEEEEEEKEDPPVVTLEL